MPRKKIPARIHVLLARASNTALVLRRGPSKYTAVIGWNRKSDSFSIGQWLHGRIYGYRSDISPDGAYWIYYAMKKGRPYTAVAHAPYLKAEDFYAVNDTWCGGGLFLDSHTYWLNEHPAYCEESRKATPLKISLDWPDGGPKRTSEPAIYFFRLLRDGWSMAEHKTNEDMEETVFLKQAAPHWNLVKHFYGTLRRSIGKGVHYEEHALEHRERSERIPCPRWEWADVDGGRIVWAEEGRIMAGILCPHGLAGIRPLYDVDAACNGFGGLRPY